MQSTERGEEGTLKSWKEEREGVWVDGKESKKESKLGKGEGGGRLFVTEKSQPFVKLTNTQRINFHSI